MNNLNHIAFIMDGNGRWGLKKKKSRNYGHLEGVKTVQKMVETSIVFKIPIISFYVFSSENWKRPRSEINYLFNLIKIYFKKEIDNIIKNEIKINISGRLNNLPSGIKKTLISAVKKTKKNKKLIVNLAINYGSRQEITHAVKKIASDALLKNIKINEITEATIANSLYTEGVPDPDLIIRTGGDCRLSNFLLWQSAYSELLFIKKAWPDFSKDDFVHAVNEFNGRERRFGGC